MDTSGQGDPNAATNAVIDGTKRLSLSGGQPSPDPKETSNLSSDHGKIDSAAVAAVTRLDGHPYPSISTTPSVAPHQPQPHITPQPMSTKVYYHIDDEKTPYCTDVQVPPDRITLGDFKMVLNRSNFKYFCKAPAPDSAVFEEVKVEIRDENERLYRSANGQFELFLLTSEGSSHSDGSTGLPLKAARHHLVPGPAPALYPVGTVAYRQAVQQFDQSMISTDSESMISDMRGLPIHMKNAAAMGRRTYQQQYLMPQGHRAGGRRFEDSTIGSESDARLFSDDDDRSRVSTSTDITSVSRQHHMNAYRKRRNRRKFRQPSRASSFSSITESSMSLDVITVTLNMDTVNFLGISIVGQSSSRGDNGIYVANIMKGGAVALDGRIEPGDMILQVNDISFENFTNDQAVDVLRESVARRGPIKLTVAKMWDGGPRSAFTVPRHRDEPVRPIDTQAWIQHTNAMRGMPSILEGSEGAPTPVPGQYGRPPSSGTMTSNGSAPNTIVAGGIGGSIRLATTTDKKRIVQMMVMPNSGLDIKNRTWLKIPIPMSFLGSDLVDWLMEHVDGLRDRKDGRKFAGELLKEKLISHVVNKITFTEQCYYILGDECAEFARLRQIPPTSTNDDGTGVRSEVGSILPPPPPGLMAAAAAAQQQQGCPNRVAGVWPSSQQQQQQPGGVVGGVMLQNAPPSMVSGYASMPISPYPGQQSSQQQQAQMFAASSGMIHHGLLNPSAAIYKGAGGGPDVHSQTSSNDGSSGSDRQQNMRVGRAVLPPAPVPSLSTLSQHIQVSSSVGGGGGSSSLAAGPSSLNQPNRLDELPQDLASSRQSFRIAMSQPFEFFVDNL